MKKCKMTMSGKHIWIMKEDTKGDAFVSYVIVCKACGMMDDRKKNYEKNTKQNKNNR